MISDPRPDWQPEEQQVQRFRAVLRVIERRAELANVTRDEYFAGVIAGTYPRVEQFEIDTLDHEN